jgi:hypothetical protein
LPSGIHNDLVILATSLRIELITTIAVPEILNTGDVIMGILTLLNRTLMRLDAVVNEVLAERLTEGVGVPQNGSSDVLTRLSSGGVVSEGRGAHRVVPLCIKVL